MFDLELWDSDARYLVVDDVDFTTVWKAIWGAQKQITLTDKFKRKRTMLWGKPLIWLCNVDETPFDAVDKRGNFLLRGAQREWWEANCVRVDLAPNFLFPIGPINNIMNTYFLTPGSTSSLPLLLILILRETAASWRRLTNPKSASGTFKRP